jgi:hypothetical protein
VAEGDFKKALMQHGGCGLFIYAVGAFFLFGIVYMIFSGGSPENKKFFDDCYRRETNQYLPGYVPDFAIEQAVVTCTKELRRARGLN